MLLKAPDALSRIGEGSSADAVRVRNVYGAMMCSTFDPEVVRFGSWYSPPCPSGAQP
jgi:hypothetical protein